MLTKDSILTYVPGSPGQQGTPARAAHPAYTESKQVTERVFVCLRSHIGTNPFSPNPFALSVICDLGVYKDVTRTVLVNHPASGGAPGQAAKPATKGQWKAKHNLGWNAGAHSIERRTGDIYVSFKIPSASGVIVGFNPKSIGVGFNEIAHGLYFQAGVVRVYESGAAKGGVLSFAPTDTFTIERVNQRVSYYRAVAGGSPVLMYQSTILSTLSVILDAAMYSGGDRID